MEIRFDSPKKLVFDRVLSSLDSLVLDFTSILEREGVQYVVVSGYVAILFGRSRGTEDVDVLIERVPQPEFEALWTRITAQFEALNAPDPEKAYDSLVRGVAIRFSRKGKFIPNVEVKFSKDDSDRYSLKNGIEAIVNGKRLRISPLELQIAYKLFLASDKDIEDARFLYRLFKDRLDSGLLKRFIKQLSIKPSMVKKCLGGI